MSSCNALLGLIQSMMNPKSNAGFIRNTPTPGFGIRKNLRPILIGNIFEELPFTLLLNLTTRVYYMFANMASLNHWRRMRGFSESGCFDRRNLEV